MIKHFWLYSVISCNNGNFFSIQYFCQFCRSINYSINGYHRQHIVVMAEVVSVALELSSDEVELKPSAGLLADSGNCYLQLCKEKVNKNALLYSTDVY